MPGELFVEYQLFAQRLRPDLFVAMAAYGDYSPGYIGTRIAYTQGGYETGPHRARRPKLKTSWSRPSATCSMLETVRPTHHQRSRRPHRGQQNDSRDNKLVSTAGQRRTLMADIRLKRAYETPAPGDGVRILVERLWPRGLTKERAAVDCWMKDVAPSPDLRRWYGHDVAKWSEFQKRYHD